LVIEGSIFPVSSGTFAYTVWAGPHNLGTGHQVAKYVVDQVLVGATTEIRLRVLDYQTIPAGTSFTGSTAILRAARNHIVDAAVSDWSELLGAPTSTSASPTSKYHRLGRALAPIAYGAGQELNFGSDFGAYSIGSGLTAFDRLYVRSWPQGFPVEPNGTEYFLYGTLFSLIPGTIVQGRYDVVCPMRSAWDLHRAWPQADLRIVADAGHSAFETGTIHELVSATDRYAGTRS
jgi:pimeloyl-ACP methyl ester carboxylesterase